MRNRFNEQLEQLNVELIKMGALCEEAISAATKAYVEGAESWESGPGAWSKTSTTRSGISRASV